MSKSQPPRMSLRRVPPVKENQEEEWLGGEAHVRPQEQPLDVFHVLWTIGTRHTGFALGLAFLGGLALGSTVASLIARGQRD